MVSPPGFPIVFFDGVCGLCNGLVDRLLRWDRRRVLRFATLQGETARNLLGVERGGDLETVVLLDAKGVATRSEAVLRTFAHLGGLWRAMGVLRVVPRPLRDAAYAFIAAGRYRWFGRRETCRVPTPPELLRFLP